MNAIFKKLDEEEMKALIRFMKASEISTSAQPSLKLDLPPVDIKLDGPETYLSWSRWITYALGGKRLDVFLTRKEKEPAAGTTEWEEWKARHVVVYMVTQLDDPVNYCEPVTVDIIQNVQDIWVKLRRTYAGAENNMRVFQIK
jgi:predicted nucleotidyltransferase